MDTTLTQNCLGEFLCELAKSRGVIHHQENIVAVERAINGDIAAVNN